MGRLDGKVTWITRAGTGIGKAAPQRKFDAIVSRFARPDILVKYAGLDIFERNWRDLQPGNPGKLVRCVAGLPKQKCMNEVLVTPTFNRTYEAALQHAHVTS